VHKKRSEKNIPQFLLNLLYYAQIYGIIKQMWLNSAVLAAVQHHFVTNNKGVIL
jgi:hypothetical protein